MNIRKKDKLLHARIEEIGIEPELYKKKKRMVEIAKILRERNPNITDEYVNFLVYREAIAELLRDDLFWLIKWVTPNAAQYRIQEVHKVICEFMKVGEKAIPPKFKWGAKFAFRPEYVEHINNLGQKVIVDNNPMLIQVSRGLGKSVMFNVIKAIQRYIQDPLSKGYLVHGDVNKAEEMLIMIRRFITGSEYLPLIFPDMFFTEEKEYVSKDGGRITSKKINIATTLNLKEFNDASDVRREATWSIGSPRTSATGMHFDYEHDDDLVIDDTSKNQEATENIRKYYINNFPLANTPGIYPRLSVGTEWWEKSMYDWLKKRCTYFYLPATWTDDKNKVYFSASYYNEKTLKSLKDKYEEWFGPHIMLEPRPLNTALKLVNDEDFIFQFNDEDDRYSTVDMTEEFLNNTGFVVTSKDPSYSRLNKTWSSDCSKDTTITAIAKDNVLYIVDESQLLGGDPTQIYMPLLWQVEKHKSDMVVIDAQGTQIYQAQDMSKKISNDVTWGNDMFFKYHKKPEGTSKGKAERAMFSLAQLFNDGKIKVHYKCKRLIAEVKRDSAGYDFLDTIIQICAVGIETLSNVEKVSKGGLVTLMELNKPVEYVNKITGY